HHDYSLLALKNFPLIRRQLRADFHLLRLQFETPAGRVARFVLQQLHARNGDLAANLLDGDQLGGGVPVALRFAADLHASGSLEPGADFVVAAGRVDQLGQIRGFRIIFAVFQMHALHERVEDAAGLEQAQRPFDEARQVVGIGEAAEHVRNDLEFSQLLGRVLPQTLAGEIAYAVVAEARCPPMPFVRPAVLDRHRNRAHFAGGPRAHFTRRVGFGRVVVQNGLAGAGADIQPSVRAAQRTERSAEAGKHLQIAQERSAGDVAFGDVGAATVKYFLLLGDLLVEARRCGLLRPARAQRERLYGNSEYDGQAQRLAREYFCRD